ncbi:MAG: class I SAM-dependent methyltransferase [Pseudomonadota bacterium]
MADLKQAYSLQSPEDARALYRDWAETYDTGFAEANGYIYPFEVARIAVDHLDPGSGHVLDVGAGTGLVAIAMQKMSGTDGPEIDGLDISPEMLAIARRQGCYRKTLVADLTKPLDIPDASYGGVVSAGTFTHGHVGPDAIDELLRITRSGGVLILGINAELYESMDFASHLDALKPQIENLSIVDVPIYDRAALDAPISDLAKVAVITRN